MNNTPVFCDDTCTELRKEFVAQNTAAVESDDLALERARLVTRYGEGNVWTTDDLRHKFFIESFCAPFCAVVRRHDLAKGFVEFQHSPRLYFNFTISPCK